MARQANSGLKRTGYAGITFGLVSLLLCELPLLLAFVGVSSFGIAAMTFQPHPLLEVAGFLAALTGLLLIVAAAVMRR